MKTLTLVPIGDTYINPLEIAAIKKDNYNPKRTEITLRSNQASVIINLDVDQVIERLKNHFN